MQKLLNPRNDVAFKRLFGTEKNKDILLCLLNEVLKKQIHYPIVDVEFLKPIMDRDLLCKKQSIVDVLCRDEDGCQYIIEMQVANAAGFEERAQYYAYKAFISQLNKGGKYSTLKEVIFLAFTDFSMFPDNPQYKSEHVTLDTKTYKRHLDKISFTFVDLVKFDQQRSLNIEALSLEEKFYYFLKHADDITPEDLEKLIRSNQIMERAFKELNTVYWTDQELLIYEDDEKRQRDNAAVLEYALDEGMKQGMKQGIEQGMKQGIEQGMKQGIEQGKIVTVKKMLDKNFDISIIKELTGLTEKEIGKLQEKIPELKI